MQNNYEGPITKKNDEGHWDIEIICIYTYKYTHMYVYIYIYIHT